ncbi:MAG: hypothetical protein HYU64_04760 [Armatimonadetes bacterium]|nr:hypothetical protein [Armatimonadota bacterium]
MEEVNCGQKDLTRPKPRRSPDDHFMVNSLGQRLSGPSPIQPVNHLISCLHKLIGFREMRAAFCDIQSQPFGWLGPTPAPRGRWR